MLRQTHQQGLTGVSAVSAWHHGVRLGDPVRGKRAPVLHSSKSPPVSAQETVTLERFERSRLVTPASRLMQGHTALLNLGSDADELFCRQMPIVVDLDELDIRPS